MKRVRGSQATIFDTELSVLTRKFYSRKVLKLKTYFNLQYDNENQGLVV